MAVFCTAGLPVGGAGLAAVMSRLRIGLFGSPSLTFDAAPWPFSAPQRCLMLLALFALRREPMSRATIAAALWPDELDAEARANLRRHVYCLKRALPRIGVEWIRDQAGGLSWNHDAAPIDVAAFVSGIGDSAQMADAAEIYAGDLLDGFEHEWLVVERERLRILYLDALRDLCGAARKRRDFAAAVRYAERLLAHDDLREDALRELIAARYEEGDRAAALGTYERFVLRLRDALDVEPMPETIALGDAIAAGLPLQHADASPFGTDIPLRDARGTPFAGRRGELETLQRAWMRAARGFGSTIFLGGDAGIGKSRLAAEFAAIVERQGGRVLVGGTAQPEGPPYQPLVTAAQRGLVALGRDALDPVWASALTDVLPEIRAMRPDLGTMEPLDGDRARVRLHESLARLFESIARGRPLVLVLEDLHWAGRDTIDAVEAVAWRGTGSPVLIVATYRLDEIGDANGLSSLSRKLVSERRATRVVLGSLRDLEIENLIARTDTLRLAPGELAHAVVRLSEGNPLFVWQLLRSYEETQTIPDGEDAVRTVGDAIVARVERLAPDVRVVADVAATVGRRFTVKMVAAVGGWSEAFVESAVDQLLARRLTHAAAEAGTYVFAHALIANALYALTALAERASRHRRIACYLEESADRDRTTLGELARHWEAAHDRPRAYRATLRAAEAALGVFARNEAAMYARRAADLAASDTDAYAALAIALRAAERGADVEGRKADLDRLDEIVVHLGDAERFFALEAASAYHLHVGDAERQARSVDAMFALAEGSRYPRRRIAALEARADLLSGGSGVGQAEAPLAEAVALAHGIGDEALHIRLSMRLAYVRIRLGKAGEAFDLLQRRREALTPAGSPPEWLDLLNAEVNCAFVLENLETGTRAAEEQLALAHRVGDVESESRAHGALSYMAHLRGDAAGMRTHSDLAITAFERTGHGRSLSVTLGNRGTHEIELGRIDEALRFSERAGTIAGRAGTRDVVATALLNRAEAELVRERFDVAVTIAAEALEVSRATGEERIIAEGLVVLGAAKCALGESAAGLRDLREGVARRRAAGGPRSFPHELTHLLEALVRAGDLPAAAEAAAELAALDVAGARYPARVHFVLGAFHDAAGDAWAARQHREEGRRLLRARLSALGPEDAKAYGALPFSRALLRPGGPGAAAGLR
jgi:DNA-binding SARP family transcriptional activator